MEEYIGMLLQSRTQTHVYHLQTKSYAKHKALEDYYEEVVELIDKVAEVYQGKYGILKNIKFNIQVNNLKKDSDILSYLEKLCEYCEKKRESLPQEGALVNLYDEVQTLISNTKYKIKNLS